MTDGNHFTGPGEHIPDRKMADLVRYASVAIAMGFDPDKPDFINVSRMERPDNMIPLHYEIRQLREITAALEQRAFEAGNPTDHDALDVAELLKAINIVRRDAPGKVEEWGSCEVTVGPRNALAIAGIRQLDEVVINVEGGVKFMDTSDAKKPDVELDGPLIYYHKADHEMFGSKAPGNSNDCDVDSWGDFE